MRIRLAAACLTTALGLTGCQCGRFMWVPYDNGCGHEDVRHVPAVETVPAAPPKLTLDDSGDNCRSAPCAEARKPRTVFVRGPQQKIVIERECPHEEKMAAAKAPAPERVAAAPGAAQDVILVPRTVYVPYVAQTPTQAARLVTPVATVDDRETERQSATTPAPPPASTRVEGPKATLAPPACATECQPTTIIEIRQMNDRIDRLHRILERLCAPVQRLRSE